MTRYEYTVIPAPNRGEKAKGARSGIERFSHALTTAMNGMAAQGWEYVRAETLPCDERTGLTGRTTVYHNVLVFRRALGHPAAAPQPQVVAAPVAATASAPADAPHHAAPQVVPPAAPPQLHPDHPRSGQGGAPAPHDPPSDWPDGGAASAPAHRPHVPERVPADADAPEDALILDEDTPERPQFGQPMPKAAPPKLGPAKR